MPYRQQLEALEADGASPSPLMQPDEAVDSIRRGDRSIAALTYGWAMGGNPDPTGERVAILQRALAELPYIVGLFWDYPSLFQHPRDATQVAIFKRAIKIMADLYASAIGTTVLQLKEIPLRPKEYDGVICLFEMAKGADEAAVRMALETFGAIESIDMGVSFATVRFSTHESARAARRAAAELTSIAGGVDTQFNERSYDGTWLYGPLAL